MPTGIPIQLAIKIAVVAGPVRRFVVGIPTYQSIDVLVGTTLDRMANAEKLAERHEILVGPTIADQLDIEIKEERRHELSGENFSVVQNLSQRANPVSWEEVAVLNPEASMPWVLPAISNRINRGEGEFLTEFRLAVPLFLKFSGLDYDSDEQAGEKLDLFIQWLQTLIIEFNGALLQLTVGDKGSYLYAVFGAPISNEDDPQRAVEFALRTRQKPPELDFIKSIQIGITQGRLRAGAYGSPTRRVYGVLGDDVNISARLMNLAPPNQILLSPGLLEQLNQIEVESLGPVTLKGISDSVETYRVVGKQLENLGNGLPVNSKQSALIGRIEEKQILNQAINALKAESKRGLVVIEGEAGVGKSRLLQHVHQETASSGLLTVIGGGDSIESKALFHAWRPIFKTIFADLDGLDQADRQNAFKELLKNKPYFLERLPLLNSVFSIGIPENQFSSQLVGKIRLENSIKLMVEIVGQFQDSKPLVIIMEDGHWMDSASWQLFREISNQADNTLVFLGLRPVSDALAEFYDELLLLDETVHIKLKNLSRDDSLTLVCQQLGLSELPNGVAEFIQDKTEGHPYFSEELAYALRDSGVLQIENGVAKLTMDIDKFSSLEFPDTIQGVILSRIDRLPFPQQLMLKVASVIGRIFAYRTLYHIHPVESDKNLLLQHLENLDELRITPKEAPEPDLAYIFKHVITQEVAYSIMLFSQRREIHGTVAEWFESNSGDDLSSVYPLLAHHWTKAEVFDKALYYLEKAGQQAFLNFAIKETIYFYKSALAIAAAEHMTVDSERVAFWKIQIGSAYANVSKYVEARTYLEDGLAMLGEPISRRPFIAISKLFGQIFTQMWHRFRPVVPHNQTKEEINRIHIISKAYESLNEAYYVTGESSILLISSILKTLNNAERIPSTAQLAQSNASFGVILGYLSLFNMSESYFERADKILDELENLESRALSNIIMGFSYSGRGLWDKAETLFEEGKEVSKKIGDMRRWDDCQSNLVYINGLKGQFQESLELAEELYTSGTKREDTIYQAAGKRGLSTALIHQGEFEKASNLLDEFQTIIESDANKESEILQIELNGLFAILFARIRKWEKSLEFTEKLNQFTGRGMPTSYGALLGYAGAAEVYLTLWETRSPVQNIQEIAKEACEVLAKYANTFPIGKPRFLLWQGVYHWLNHNQSKANKLWQKGLVAAETLNMPYDQGLIHFEIGRHLNMDDPNRLHHLNKALEIFSQLGANYDRIRVEEALKNK